jgi:hypothetical protein
MARSSYRQLAWRLGAIGNALIFIKVRAACGV